MLKKSLKVALIAAALAAGAAHASDYVVAGGAPVRTASGACVQTGSWTAASGPCDRALSVEVLFEFDSAELGAEGRRLLDDLVASAAPGQLERVFASAHADRIGASHYNLLLSERRLEAIREYLMEKDVPLPSLFTKAKGDAEPATAGQCDDMGPENRENAGLVECLQPDRRVEVEVLAR